MTNPIQDFDELRQAMAARNRAAQRALRMTYAALCISTGVNIALAAALLWGMR